MKTCPSLTTLMRWVTLAGVTLLLAACNSVSSLYNGDDIHVAARTTVLEQDVEVVSDDYRSLLNRYETLERLYIELATRRDEQDSALRRLESQVADAARAQELRTSLSAVETQVKELKDQFSGMEERLFTVSVGGPATARFPDAAVAEKAVLPAPGSSVPGTPAPGATAGGAIAASATAVPEGIARPAGAAATAAVDTDTSDAGGDETPRFGVHIASYRSDDQVSGGWSGLQQRLNQVISDFQPLIFSQNQPGIGRFLRLIVGPLSNEQEAEALCNDIRGIDSEQYCRVTDYEGDSLP